MDALKKFKPFLVCHEDGGLPARLVGESDIRSWPPTEEMMFELEWQDGEELCDEVDLKSRISGRAVHRGCRVRLTTHRLFWRAVGHNSWLALRLDAIESLENWGGMLRSLRCMLRLSCGTPAYVKGSSEPVTLDLLMEVRTAVQNGRWCDGSYEVAAQAGLQRLLNNQVSKQQATGATLDVALADLDSLRRHAAEAAKAAKQVVSGLSRPGAGYEGAAQVDSDVSKLLEDFGLLQADGSTISMSGGQKKDDIVEDVRKVSTAALEKKGAGSLLLAHDVFCLVNRARGTALVSPGEVIQALRSCCKPGGPLRMRKLGSVGALAVALARTSDAEMDAPLMKMLEEAPLSAFRVSAELKITAAEARYLLQDAEQRAILARDDAPECVYFYRNFFNDY
ncbi:unnamed protein product [Durusdinium trenchii]|uniref:Uncharacterized protein n=2 Tax=Durusdinium trenchii TaxID=1381693 RepID=A0ABP0M3W8_9DINO